ncbi:MAG: hypothetical protein ABJH05_04820 [Fulvivirga sp.]
MRKISLLIALLIGTISTAFACQVCKRNQPEPLQNITHGAGPQSDLDYVIIGVGIVIVSLTLFYSIKYLIKPGEKRSDHIKNIVFKEGLM